EAEARQARHGSGLAEEAREPVAGLPIPVAAEVDPRQDDLAVALRDPAPDLGEHGFRAARAGGAADERDDAEAAREAAAVLHLDEGADAVEARLRLHAGDRPDGPGDGLRRLLAAARDDYHVVRQAGEGVRQVRRATGE